MTPVKVNRSGVATLRSRKQSTAASSGRDDRKFADAAVSCAYDESVSQADEERVALAKLACGDIPAQYCNVVDVEVIGEGASVWLLTNGPSDFERYQVDFVRREGVWDDAVGSGGFQTDTPDHVRRRAKQLEAELRRDARAKHGPA